MVAWIPFEDVDSERFHTLYFKCRYCHPLSTACQYFGHSDTEITCDRQMGLTVMDKPICENSLCEDQDFLEASHYLIQRFVDVHFNEFLVFFRNPKEVDDFFSCFPAKDCLEDDSVWCEFQAVKQWHKSRYQCSIPKFFEVVLFERLQPSKRLFHVSGKLPPIGD